MAISSTFSSLKRSTLTAKLQEPVDAASLAFFRIAFGLIMLYSTIRFVVKGWVHLFYIKPTFFFKYFGFQSIQPLTGNGMYLPWIGMIICLIFIILGKYYRVAIISFFLLFSYTELLDLTNYLNHYYLVTLLSFIMIFLPMNAAFSLDAKKWGYPAVVPRWALTVLRLQIGLVYFFAGVSKIKYDWLIQAEPMKIWLGAFENIPLAGKLLAMNITAYIFSWAGMLFDISAPFFLLSKKTRPYEYALIVIFHSLTMWFFYIGIFPLLMMVVALIFFSPPFHRRILEKYFFFLKKNNATVEKDIPSFYLSRRAIGFWAIYFLWQIIMPFRYLLYKDNVLWTEQGFRYSWNVMLMEKDGYAEFTIKDNETGKKFVEFPKKYLTPLQERMMSTQPDMILQYAHFLAGKYREKLHHNVSVYVYSYVSLNAKPGQLYIDPKTDLAKVTENFCAKEWILPLQ